MVTIPHGVPASSTHHGLLMTGYWWCRSIPALPSFWRRWWRSASIFHWRIAAAATTSEYAAEECEEDESSNGRGKPNDQGFVAVDPRLDFTAHARAFALTLHPSQIHKQADGKGHYSHSNNYLRHHNQYRRGSFVEPNNKCWLQSRDCHT